MLGRRSHAIRLSSRIAGEGKQSYRRMSAFANNAKRQASESAGGPRGSGSGAQQSSATNGTKKNSSSASESTSGGSSAQQDLLKGSFAGAAGKFMEAFKGASEQAYKTAQQTRQTFEKTAEHLGSQEETQKIKSEGKKYASFLRDKTRFLWQSTIVEDIKGSVADTKRTIIDENAYRYGGMTSKAYRTRIREQRLKGFTESAEAAGGEAVAENPNAGANVVLHKDSKWKEAWSSFKESNPVVQGIFSMRRRYEESDNVLVNTSRVIGDRFREMFGSVFEETEHAQALAEIREIDPSFTLEAFMKEAREFMIPEVLEAYVDWEPKTLKSWCSDAVFSVLEASREPLIHQMHSVEGRILDLRNVDLAMAKLMDDGTPLLLITFKTQQIEVVRDKAGEIVSGSPDKVNDVYYIWAMAKDTEKPNPLTKGWKIVEFAIQGVRESF